MAVDDPVPPFGATVAGVLALTPDATLLPEGPAAPGRRGVTEAQVRAWLGELSARVARRLDGWQNLRDEPPTPDEPSDRAELVTAAAGVVHNGAASYLEAARHPEQAGKSSTTYAAVLWQRFEAGLDELAGWLTARLATGDTSEPATSTPGLAFAFPDPSFTADLRF